MANICEYRLRIKGKKENCYHFLNSMSVYSNCETFKEEGTDDSFIIEAIGDCKWDVYAYIKKVPAKFNFEEALKRALEGDYSAFFNLPLKDKSKMFDIEVQISWTDVEDIELDARTNNLLKYSYEHWNKGEKIKPEKGERRETFFAFIVDDYIIIDDYI
jgi:hypothetical protein